jgi:hypothetical protein
MSNVCCTIRLHKREYSEQISSLIIHKEYIYNLSLIPNGFAFRSHFSILAHGLVMHSFLTFVLKIYLWLNIEYTPLTKLQKKYL